MSNAATDGGRAVVGSAALSLVLEDFDDMNSASSDQFGFPILERCGALQLSPITFLKKKGPPPLPLSHLRRTLSTTSTTYGIPC